MTEYIRKDNGFIAYERAPAGTEGFRNYAELSHMGKEWNGKMIVDLYNTIATEQGKTTVQRFMNREAGMKRLWTLIQELPVHQTQEPPTQNVTGERASKKATVLAMVQQESGATLEELMGATGWQAHSVRGFLSVQRKDYDITRIKRPDDLIAYYATKKVESSSMG